MNVSSERMGERVCLHLSGSFDFDSNVGFRNAWRPWLKEDEVGCLALDFSEVPCIDSSALGMLLLLRQQAGFAGKRVVLSHCGPDLQKILSIAHFDSLFSIE